MHSGEPSPSGALRLWREELRRGVYGQDARRASTWRYDTLWEAACWESAGIEAAREGFARVARDCFARADKALEGLASPDHGPAA